MLLTRTDHAKQVTNPQTPFTAKIVQIFVIDPVEISLKRLVNLRDIWFQRNATRPPFATGEELRCKRLKKVAISSSGFELFGIRAAFREHTTTPDTLMASVERAKYLDKLKAAPFINRLATLLAINALIQMLNLQWKMLSRFSDVFVQFKFVLPNLDKTDNVLCFYCFQLGSCF